MIKIKHNNGFVVCPLCRHESKCIFNKTLCDDIDIKILKCSSCQLIFDDTSIEKTKLDKFISEEYYKTKDVGSKIDQRFIKHFTRRANIHIKLILKFFPNKFKGKVLDVGCGGGMFLHEMEKKCWSVVGVEPSYEHYQYATEVLGLDVWNCLFHEYVSNDKFDLIYFSHVFDDLPKLDLVFEKMDSLLLPNGRVFIEVPNHNRDRGFKSVKNGDFIENQFYFTASSIKNIFENNGYRIEYLKTYESIYLNTFLQYLAGPYKLMKRWLTPDVNKEQIRLVATKAR